MKQIISQALPKVGKGALFDSRSHCGFYFSWDNILHYIPVCWLYPPRNETKTNWRNGENCI